MAKLGLRRGPQATTPSLAKGELGLKLDRKKLVTSVDGVTNITLSPLQIWDPSTLYMALEDLVVFGGQIYQCNTQHTSSVFATDSANWTLVTKPGQRVVADIAGRDALTGHELFEALACYVIDASADPTVTAGAALYVYSSAAWVKISEFESLDVVIDDAAEGTKGIIEIATEAEVLGGSAVDKAVRPHHAKALVDVVDFKVGTRSDLPSYDAGSVGYEATNSLGPSSLLTNVALVEGGSNSGAPLTTVFDDVTSGSPRRIATGSYLGAKHDSLVLPGFLRVHGSLGGFSAAGVTYRIDGLTVQDGEGSEGNWSAIPINSINVTTGTVVAGGLTGEFTASTTTAYNVDLVISDSTQYYGFRVYAVSGANSEFYFTEIQMFEPSGVASPLVNTVSEIVRLEAEKGDLALLTEGSPDLVTEINLKASSLDLLGKLSTADSGARTDLYRFNPANITYEATDTLSAGGVDFSTAGASANAFDSNDTTSTSAQSVNSYVGKIFPGAPISLGKFRTFMSVYNNTHAQKVQGLTVDGGEATPGNWVDIQLSGIEGADASEWEILNGDEMHHTNRVATANTFVDQEVIGLTNDTTAYYGFRLLLVSTQATGTYTKSFEGYQVSGVPDNTTTFVSAINDLEANKAEASDVGSISALSLNNLAASYGSNLLFGPTNITSSITAQFGAVSQIFDGLFHSDDSNVNNSGAQFTNNNVYPVTIEKTLASVQNITKHVIDTNVTDGGAGRHVTSFRINAKNIADQSWTALQVSSLVNATTADNFIILPTPTSVVEVYTTNTESYDMYQLELLSGNHAQYVSIYEWEAYVNSVPQVNIVEAINELEANKAEKSVVGTQEDMFSANNIPSEFSTTDSITTGTLHVSGVGSSEGQVTNGANVIDNNDTTTADMYLNSGAGSILPAPLALAQFELVKSPNGSNYITGGRVQGFDGSDWVDLTITEVTGPTASLNGDGITIDLTNPAGVETNVITTNNVVAYEGYRFFASSISGIYSGRVNSFRGYEATAFITSGTLVEAVNNLDTRVALIGQPGDVTIESAIPANAAVLTYGSNVITAGNSGLAADIVDGVDSNISYTDITAGSRRVITFAGPTAIRKVAVRSWHTAGSQQGPVKIQYSDDGSTWFDAGTQINVLSTLQEYEFDNNGAHTFWAILSVDVDSILLSYLQAYEGATFDASRFLQVVEGSLGSEHLASLNGISDAMISRTDSSVSATVLATDQLVRLDATTAGASQTATLPAISSVFDGKLVTVLGQGTTAFPALVQADGSDTISGGSITLNEDGQAVTFVANLVTSQWEIVAHVKPSLAAGAVTVQNNFAGTTAPTVTNDASEGYAVGSAWLDTTASPAESYRCADATNGAAVWIKTSLTYDELPSSRASVSYNSASGNTTYAVTDKLMVITMAGTNDVQLTLNAASGYPDDIKIKRLGSGTGSITLLPNGTEEIDGATGVFDATPFINTAGDSISLAPVTNGFVLA